MITAGPSKRVISRSQIHELWKWLAGQGYQVVGPRVHEGAIVYDEVSGPEDLPVGWTDEQSGGRYRLKRRDDQALFGYNVGPHSWKKFLFPSKRRLWTADRDGKDVRIENEPSPTGKYAFLGVRACELNAILIQDRVFSEGQLKDPYYVSRRESAFLIAVNCGQAGGTCFCVSMDAGPECRTGYDIVLTELMDGGRHEFLLQAGTARGEGY